MKPLRSLAITLLAGASLLLVACGGDDDSAASDGESNVDAAALEGVSVTVGSKDFTENILLGEMLGLRDAFRRQVEFLLRPLEHAARPSPQQQQIRRHRNREPFRPQRGERRSRTCSPAPST